MFRRDAEIDTRDACSPQPKSRERKFLVDGRFVRNESDLSWHLGDVCESVPSPGRLPASSFGGDFFSRLFGIVKKIRSRFDRQVEDFSICISDARKIPLLHCAPVRFWDGT